MKKQILAILMVVVISLCAVTVMAEENTSLALAGRTAVFAGGTGNIGSGAVRLLAENGMNVVLETHNPASADALKEELADAPGTVDALSNELGYDELFAQVAEQYGSVDVLIISTGDMGAAADIENLDVDDLQSRLNNKVIDAVKRVKAALPYLKQSEHARIILTSNAGALDGNETESTLDEICGGAVISMTYAFARELADEGVTVNCIARSGLINDHDPEEGKLDVNTYLEQIPAGAPGTAENYGALVLYLASEQSDFTTGNIFNLSGGFRIG